MLPPSPITYSDEFEAILVAQAFHHTLESYEILPVERQALLVAAYRDKNTMESVESHFAVERAKQEAARSK